MGYGLKAKESESVCYLAYVRKGLTVVQLSVAGARTVACERD